MKFALCAVLLACSVQAASAQSMMPSRTQYRTRDLQPAGTLNIPQPGNTGNLDLGNLKPEAGNINQKPDLSPPGTLNIPSTVSSPSAPVFCLVGPC